MALLGIPISEEQCIGDSLTYINQAFQTLDTRTLSFSTTDLTTVPTDTIELDFDSSTRRLQGIVVNDSINFNKINTFLKEAIARAWVVFSSTGAVLTSYNVQSVVKLGTGQFDIKFSGSFNSTNYCVSDSYKNNSINYIIVSNYAQKNLDSLEMVYHYLSANTAKQFERDLVDPAEASVVVFAAE